MSERRESAFCSGPPQLALALPGHGALQPPGAMPRYVGSALPAQHWLLFWVA